MNANGVIAFHSNGCAAKKGWSGNRSEMKTGFQQAQRGCGIDAAQNQRDAVLGLPVKSSHPGKAVSESKVL